jgi:uncharacterized protein YdcH (DUF465 family)
MAIQPDKIKGILESAKSKNIDPSSFKTSLGDVATPSAISDPVGGLINKGLTKINSLTGAVEKKIDKLLEDTIKSTDAKGRVKLVGNQIIITVSPEDKDKADAIKSRIQNNIESINKNLNSLQNLLKSLETINQTVTILNRILDIQELALKSNPVSAATFTVIKKAVKIIFTKDMMKEYSKLLRSQLKQNQTKLNSLLQKFKGLRVQIQVDDNNNNGVTNQNVNEQIAQSMLGVGDNMSADYTNINGIEFVLKVEVYGKKDLIGKAYDKYSGMIAAQTAPSIVSTPEDLFEELKTIINQMV